MPGLRGHEVGNGDFQDKDSTGDPTASPSQGLPDTPQRHPAYSLWQHTHLKSLKGCERALCQYQRATKPHLQEGEVTCPGFPKSGRQGLYSKPRVTGSGPAAWEALPVQHDHYPGVWAACDYRRHGPSPDFYRKGVEGVRAQNDPSRRDSGLGPGGEPTKALSGQGRRAGGPFSRTPRCAAGPHPRHSPYTATSS